MMMGQFLLKLGSGLILFCTAAGEEGFYNIVHMASTKASVDWAIGVGANAVEIDLNFDYSTGILRRFGHSLPGKSCGCTCLCPAPNWSLCGTLYPNSVCAKLLDDVSFTSPCEAESTVRGLLNHMATKKGLALIVIDSRVDTAHMSSSSMRNAGEAVVMALESHLFGANYGGMVIIGSPKLNTLPYLQAAVEKANNSSFKSRIYFTIDMENNHIVETLNKLLTLPTKNIVYGTGFGACYRQFSKYETTLQLGLLNKAKGVVGLSYTWTTDEESSMKSNLQYVQGMLTNYPGKLYDILVAAGIKMATQNSSIPASTNSVVTTSISQFICECDYHPGGCSVSSAAPSGLACKCRYKGLWTCDGSVVQCSDSANQYCRTPDKTVHSCLQGGGDCEGYKTATCDCNYNPGGCSISQTPPKNTACKCTYKGASTCSGEVVRCLDFNSQYCKTPDQSVQSCFQGNGDCEGYNRSTRLV